MAVLQSRASTISIISAFLLSVLPTLAGRTRTCGVHGLLGSPAGEWRCGQRATLLASFDVMVAPARRQAGVLCHAPRVTRQRSAPQYMALPRLASPRVSEGARTLSNFRLGSSTGQFSLPLHRHGSPSTIDPLSCPPPVPFAPTTLGKHPLTRSSVPTPQSLPLRPWPLLSMVSRQGWR